jgi:hypothetical protein
MSKRLLLGILSLIIFLLLFTFWFVLYSKYLANNDNAINLRKYFDTKIASILFTTDFIQKTGFVSRNIKLYKDDGTNYQYLFVGKFSRIDLPSGIMYLKDNWGKEHGFILSFKKSSSNPNVGYIFYREALDVGAWNVTEAKWTVDLVNLENNTIPFTENDLIRVYWNDTRLMTEIFDKNYKTLNLKGVDIVTILQIKLLQ